MRIEGWIRGLERRDAFSRQDFPWHLDDADENRREVKGRGATNRATDRLAGVDGGGTATQADSEQQVELGWRSTGVGSTVQIAKTVQTLHSQSQTSQQPLERLLGW